MDGGKLIAFKTMSNSGQIEAGSRVGGIVGYCSKASIEGDGELLNTGMVHSRDVYAGGIIGKAETKTSVKIAGAAKNTVDINGPGYAGGIMSAAMDGLRIAMKIQEKKKEESNHA